MSAAWNGYCAEFDARVDADAWADWQAYMAMSDEERAANDAAVAAIVAREREAYQAAEAGKPEPPF